MEIRLLGPIEVDIGGSAADVGTSRQRAVLAVLAVEAGTPVAVESIIDRVWGQAPPRRVRDALHVYVARLRRSFRMADPGYGDVLVRRPPGYALNLDPTMVDAHRFRLLLQQARPGAQPDHIRAVHARQALDLCRGTPMAGVPGDWAAGMRSAWEQHRVDATLIWASLELAGGRADLAIDELAQLMQQHPLAEPVAAVLMRALCAVGRSTEALDRYLKVRQALVEELGVEPGHELVRLHQAILRGEIGAESQPVSPAPAPPSAIGARLAQQPGVDSGGSFRSATRGGSTPPLQLPADVAAFVGREIELRVLDDLVLAPSASPPRPTVSTITGTAGIGKTAFAIRWAHSASSRFPDGQLYVNLRGFDPLRPPTPAIEVLRGFLRALGVAPAEIPQDPDEAAARYRSELADRRMLILLDNARTAEQVRPLLPGVGTCTTLVTSRNRLTGLVASHGATPVELQLLSPQQAALLLRTIVGAKADDETATGQLAQRCAYLPLALRIAAARLLCHRHLTVDEYVHDLLHGDALAALAAEDDERSEVRAAFALSYRDLTDDARRLFRLLHLMPGQDFGREAAAALIGVGSDQARRLLHQLCDAHLVAEQQPGRYAMHDLLRRYSHAQAETEESSEALREASRRMVDFYSDTLHEAFPHFQQRRNEARRDLAYPPADPLRFPDRESALAWHDAERASLVAVTQLAAAHGWHNAAWQLADSFFGYFVSRRHWQDWFTALRVGLASAEEISHRDAAARMHNALGVVLKQTGRYDQAREHYQRGLALAEEIGNSRMVAGFHVNLGGLLVTEGDPRTAVAHLQKALADPDHGHNPQFATITYLNYACALIELDWLDEAQASLMKSLQLAEDARDLLNACYVHHNLAEVALRRNDFASAQVHAEHELELAAQLGDPLRRGAALDILGSCLAFHDQRAAVQRWEEALDVYRALQHRLSINLEDWIKVLEEGMPTAELVERDAARRRHARRMI
ncbi:BTAD domain-containing putative transcriptional regulator [Catellatospora citrea]|uniref:AfsR/SARP family transcriptional regulator n=1 Tax=Catellatospora citrea TaxID=53366 RepID=UPI0033CF5D1D